MQVLGLSFRLAVFDMGLKLGKKDLIFLVWALAREFRSHQGTGDKRNLKYEAWNLNGPQEVGGGMRKIKAVSHRLLWPP